MKCQIAGELEPETPYFVQISAINRAGEGVRSQTIPFQTKSGAPVDAPSDVLAVVAPDNTITLSWAGPTQPNGPIKGYTVYYTPADAAPSDEDSKNYKSWSKIVVPSDALTASTVLNKDEYSIQPNTQYVVRVSASNDQSEGPASDTYRFSTGSGLIPPSITISPDTTVAQVAPRTDYTATCTAEGLPTPTIRWTIGEGEAATSREGGVLQLSSITADTSATCHASNTAGEVQSTLRVEVQGPGTPPRDITLNPLPDQRLAVEWTPPDVPNGAITKYLVHYSELPEGEC